MLKRDGLDIISGSVDCPEAIDYDAEQYYELLLKEKMDIDLIDGQLEGHETPKGGNEKGAPGTGDEEPEDDNNDALRQEQIQDGEEDCDDQESEDEYALVEEKKSKAGNAVNRDNRIVENIGASAPLIDWRLLLQDTINYNPDWSYRNAVLDNGLVVPVLEEMPIPETEIVLDTSWSVDEELLKAFLRECKSILSCSKLKAGCFDTVFYGFCLLYTSRCV